MRYATIRWHPGSVPENIVIGSEQFDHHDGFVSWAVPLPPSSRTVVGAEGIQDKVRKTHDVLMGLVRQWSRFRDVYGGADQDSVFNAMSDVAGKLGGFLHGADIFASAAVTFDAEIQTQQGEKEPYDYWARGWLTRLYDWDRDKNKVYHGEWTEEEFAAHHGGMTPDQLFESLERERYEHQSTAIDIYLTIEDARNTLAKTVSGIDMEELSELAYVHRSTALEVMESPEELATVLENSSFFGGIEGLTEQDYLEIAQSIPLDELPYDYMDADGVTWSYNAEGELVRSGSAEDPYLMYAVQLSIAEDETYGDLELPNVTAPDGSYLNEPLTMREYLTAQGIDLAFGEGVGYSQSRLIDAVAEAGEMDVAGKKAFGFTTGMTVSTVVTLVKTGWDTKEFEREYAERNPLLSEEQVREQTRRYVAQELLTFLATSGTDAAVAAIPLTGVPGWLVVTLVSWGAGHVATAAIDEAYDQTWTEEERQEAYANGEIG